MIAPFLVAVGLAFPAKPFDFYAQGPYDFAVPRPESILGYRPGDQISTYRDQERVILAIAEKAKSRVRLIEYGHSVEGRPLRILAISSPENIAKLDQIREDHLVLANPMNAEAVQTALKRTVPISWINECIHGNEPASFESAMYLIYNLCASKSPAITNALKNSVVIVNPVFNPDGHERYAVYYNSLATGNPSRDAFENSEPDLIHGRLNHYRFDMNRDHVALSQDEVRQEVKEVLRWNPQVYADQHGQVETYFMPPNPMSINVNSDRNRLNHWTEIFARASARAFDAAGDSYFIKDVFDFYYPGYTDTFAGLSGIIGMTHETDGGKQLAKTRADGSVLTLRHGVEKHFISALAVVETTAERKDEFLASYLGFKQNALSGKSAGKFRTVVISGDTRALVRLQDQLGRGGIKCSIGLVPQLKGATDLWTHKKADVKLDNKTVLVVDLAQSQGPLAKALLETESDFEPEFLKAQLEKRKSAPDGEKYPGPESGEFYDTTGWSLPLAHELAAWSLETAIPAPIPVKPWNGDVTPKSNVGYAIEYRDQDDILAVADALGEGLRGMINKRPIEAGNKSYSSGTFIFLNERNEDDLYEKLTKITRNRGVTLISLTTSYPDTRFGPGSEIMNSLKKPRIAVVFGKGTEGTDFSGVWYLLDRVFKLPYTAISSDTLNADLSNYSVVILPEGTSSFASGKFRDWVSNGGIAISLGDNAWTVGSSGFVDLTTIKGTPQNLPGALFRADLDPRSFLSYGYPEQGSKIEIAIPIAGDKFYLARKEGGSVVKLAEDEKTKKLLTGWAWPDDTEKNLANTVWLQDAPVGRGHAVLFTNDPTARAMWPGLWKMLLNAMIIGPGS